MLKEADKANEQSFLLAALPKADLDANRSARYVPQADFGKPLRYKFIDSLNTGIYAIHGFNKAHIAHYGQDFETFTDSVFSDLEHQKAEHLIIDLRGNVGGWTAYGKELFTYFISKPVRYIDNVEIKKTDKFTFKELITHLPGYLDTFQFDPLPNGNYQWTNYPSLMANPCDTRFNGTVYILTDEMTRSCSGIFSSMMREHTSAIFLGQETGSSRCGAGGMVMSVRLPYTGINVHFSTAKYTTAIHDNKNASGVIPDYKTASEMALNEALKLIAEKHP